MVLGILFSVFLVIAVRVTGKKTSEYFKSKRFSKTLMLFMMHAVFNKAISEEMKRNSQPFMCTHQKNSRIAIKFDFGCHAYTYQQFYLKDVLY